LEDRLLCVVVVESHFGGVATKPVSSILSLPSVEVHLTRSSVLLHQGIPLYDDANLPSVCSVKRHNCPAYPSHNPQESETSSMFTTSQVHPH
jgi:hypothetical protein